MGDGADPQVVEDVLLGSRDRGQAPGEIAVAGSVDDRGGLARQGGLERLRNVGL